MMQLRRPVFSRRLCSAALLMVTLTSCAGPRSPLDFGIKEFSSDIVLGKQNAQLAAPIPPVALPVPAGSSFNEFNPPLVPSASPSSSAASCPAANPLQAPAKEAVRTIVAPPAVGTYAFANQGRFEVSGSNAKKGSFPNSSVREVKNVYNSSTPQGSEIRYQFDVAASLGATITTTTYTLVPEQSNAQGVGPQAGLFVSRVQSSFPDGSTEDFRPRPDLLILPFPVTVGASWNSAGTDPKSGITMAFTGTIGNKIRVDACAVPLDAWTVHLDGNTGQTKGPAKEISPSDSATFTADYAFGTQYGGVSIMDAVVVDRSELSGNLHQEDHATIDVEPFPPTTKVPFCTVGCLVS